MNGKRHISLLLACILLLGLAACGDPNAVSPASGSDDTPILDAGGGSSDGCYTPGWDGEGSPPPEPTLPEECESPIDDGGPDDSLSSSDDDMVAHEPNPGPSPVHPKPGQVNVRPLGWDNVKVSDSGRSVDVIFWSGVEPCYVLDRVEVEHRADKVVITLFQGSSPSDEDVACIDIAVQKVTTVKLEEPLGDRKIVDGARP